MICVYPADCADFSTNGNGVLTPLTAQVTETLNGEYELQLTHPIDDAGKWRRLVEGCILRAPVPAAMTPRVNFTAPGDDNRTEVWRVDTDFAGAETRRGTLNLRNGPGRNYKVLAAYKNTSLVQVIAKTNADWYEVAAPDGKRGYMSTTYLKFDHAEGSASEAVSSVVEERQLRDQPFRIRNGNGTNYARIITARNGEKFPYVATAANSWHAVIAKGQVCWVSGNYSIVQ